MLSPCPRTFALAVGQDHDRVGLIGDFSSQSKGLRLFSLFGCKTREITKIPKFLSLKWEREAGKGWLCLLDLCCRLKSLLQSK